MTRMLRTLLPAAGMALAAGPAAAQYPYAVQPYGSASPAGPPLSPYLNLRNGPNNLPGVNYYNFVRPQLNYQQALQAGGGGGVPVIDPYGLASDFTYDPTLPLPRGSGIPTGFMN